MALNENNTYLLEQRVAVLESAVKALEAALENKRPVVGVDRHRIQSDVEKALRKAVGHNFISLYVEYDPLKDCLYFTALFWAGIGVREVSHIQVQHELYSADNVERLINDNRKRI